MNLPFIATIGFMLFILYLQIEATYYLDEMLAYKQAYITISENLPIVESCNEMENK